MYVKGFQLSNGYDLINHFLNSNVRVRGVRLKGGYYFVEYDEIESKPTITKVDFIKAGLGASVPERLNRKFAIAGASNFHWDVKVDIEQRTTTFVVFWEESISKSQNHEESTKV
jgi:hypothetical protein